MTVLCYLSVRMSLPFAAIVEFQSQEISSVFWSIYNILGLIIKLNKNNNLNNNNIKISSLKRLRLKIFQVFGFVFFVCRIIGFPLINYHWSIVFTQTYNQLPTLIVGLLIVHYGLQIKFFLSIIKKHYRLKQAS